MAHRVIPSRIGEGSLTRLPEVDSLCAYRISELPEYNPGKLDKYIRI